MFSQVSLPGIPTNHDLIYGFYHVREPSEDSGITSPKFYRDFNAINNDKLLKDSSLFFMPDPNDQVEYFNAIIVSLFQAHVPLSQHFPKEKTNPWLSFEIASAMAERDIAYRIWKNDKQNDEKTVRLWHLRKTVCRMVRSAKRCFLRSRLDPDLPPIHFGETLTKLV